MQKLIMEFQKTYNNIKDNFFCFNINMIIGVDSRIMFIVSIISAIIISTEVFGKILGLSTIVTIINKITNKIEKND